MPGRGSRKSSTGSASHSRRGSFRVYQLENETIPSAPPLVMDVIQGYERVSFDAVTIPAPTDPEPEYSTCEPESHQILPTEPHVTEKQARQALHRFAKKHCCYGQGVAKNMAVTLLNYSSAFHYELQTFTEKRETSWVFKPYNGGEVDGIDNGPAPMPWGIEVFPSKMFQNEIKVMQIPHTASIKHCHRCNGTGSFACTECNSKGWIRCMSCQGDAYNTNSAGNKERCFYCYTTTHGHGRQDCCKCDATGKVQCPTCDNSGNILCFIQLTVTWKVNSSEHIVERVSLPEHLVRIALGDIAFEEQGQRVSAITHFPDEAINLASAQLLQDHMCVYSDQKTLGQRQQVRIIPVTTVHYEWKYHTGVYFVYGYENNVYAPDYPQKCCICVLM